MHGVERMSADVGHRGVRMGEVEGTKVRVRA